MTGQTPSAPELETRVDQLEELVVALASHFTSTHDPSHPDPDIRRQERKIEELGRRLFETRRARQGRVAE